MSTVTELAQIALDLLTWSRASDIPADMKRKIELVTKAIIEYEWMLNHYGES